MMAAARAESLSSRGNRILFLVSSMDAGGAERVASLLCSKWAAEGDEVVLMPTYQGGGSCAYMVHERVSVTFLAERFEAGRNARPGPLRRLRVLRNAIRELAPDIVVSFLTNVNVSVLAATLGMRIPIIVSERSFPPRHEACVIWRALRRLTYWRAAAVVVQTPRLAAWIERLCPGVDTVVIPNPVVVPLPAVEPRLRPSNYIAKGRRIALAVGRCASEKGFERLIRGFAAIAADVSDVDLVILGEGPERQALQRLAEDLGIAARVLLPGHVGNVSDWYEAASIFALTSYYEGFPNALLEAMAHGVPAVSVDCEAGPADIVRDKVDGLLLAVHSDVQDIGRALRGLLLDEAARAAMSAQARSVAERYSIQSVSARWRELFVAVRH